MHRSLKWSLPLMISDQYVRTSDFSLACYVSHPSYLLDVATLTMLDESSLHIVGLVSKRLCILLQRLLGLDNRHQIQSL